MNTVTALDSNHNLSILATNLQTFMVDAATRRMKLYTQMNPDKFSIRNSKQDAITSALDDTILVLEEHKRKKRLDNYIIERTYIKQVAKSVYRRGNWYWDGFDSTDYIDAVTVRRKDDVAYSCVIIASATPTSSSGFKHRLYALCPAYTAELKKDRIPKGIQKCYGNIVSTTTAPKTLIKTAFNAPSITLPRLLDNLYRRVAPAAFRELANFGSKTKQTAIEKFADRIVTPIRSNPKVWLEWFNSVARGEAPVLLPEMSELIAEYHTALRRAEESVLSMEQNKFVMFVQFVKDGDVYAILPDNTFVKVTPGAPVPMDAMYRAQTVLMQIENMVYKSFRIPQQPGGNSGESLELKVLPAVGVAHLSNNRNDDTLYIEHVHQIIVVPVSDAELSGVTA